MALPVTVPLVGSHVEGVAPAPQHLHPSRWALSFPLRPPIYGPPWAHGCRTSPGVGAQVSMQVLLGFWLQTFVSLQVVFI